MFKNRFSIVSFVLLLQKYCWFLSTFDTCIKYFFVCVEVQIAALRSSQRSWCPPFSGANASKQLSATSPIFNIHVQNIFCGPPSRAGALPFREPMPQSSYLQLLTDLYTKVHYLLFYPFSRAGALPFREPMPQSSYLQLLPIFNNQVQNILCGPLSGAGALPFREPMPQSSYHTWEYEKRRLLPPFQLYAQHGHVLMGESPKCALMTGSI